MTPPDEALSVTPAAASRRVPSVDGLRAASILFVLLSHLRMSIPAPTTGGLWFWRIAANSQLGVRVFFVISGFLITKLLLMEREKHGRIRLSAFYRRRFLRIFPAFYAYLLVVVGLAAAGVLPFPSRADLATAATFSWNYGHLFVHGNYAGHYLLGHSWTLSLEEQFYMLWPLTLTLAGVARARRLAVFIIVCSPFARVATYLLFPTWRGSMGELLHTTGDSLMYGCLFALTEGTARCESALAWLNRTAWPCLAAVLAACVLSPILTARFGGTYALTVGWTLESMSIVVILAYVTRVPGSTLGRLLNAPPVAYVGVLSYSLYVWSMLFFTGVNRTWTGVFPINLLCCLGCALASYTGVERPFLRLKDTARSRAPQRPLCETT